MGLSILYFFLVCGITILSITLMVSIVKSVKARLRGLYILGIVLVYAVVSVFFADLWGDLLNKWYGQWPAFVFGIVFGIPALVVTAGTVLGMIFLALYAIILGRFPVWVESVPMRSVWNRLGLGLATVFVLVALGGFILGIVLRNH